MRIKQMRISEDFDFPDIDMNTPPRQAYKKGIINAVNLDACVPPDNEYKENYVTGYRDGMDIVLKTYSPKKQ